MKEYKTEFEFKDSRHYVHSTTMLECLYRLVSENYYNEEKWEMPKVDAKFHKEVFFNGRFLLFSDEPDLSEYGAASANFRFYDKSFNIKAIFIEDRGIDVAQRIKTNYSVEDIVMERDFTATCKIGCNSRIAFTENIIEANKKVHLLTLNNRGKNLKVINLYMKGVPVSHASKNCDYLLLKIVNMSARQRGNSVVTLNSLSFHELHTEPFEISYIVEGV